MMKVHGATLAMFMSAAVAGAQVRGGMMDVGKAMLRYEVTGSRIPGARRVVIENAGHGAHIHQPDAFNREVLAFLRQVDRQ